jgi:ubiquinone/menaquinone biosynthesis C-methylase UbiE
MVLSDVPDLTPDGQQLLDSLLRNESDVAYKRRVRRMIAYLELAPGQVVLDCGCGRGYYLKIISQLAPGCQLLGIDSDPTVLEIARQQVAMDAAHILRGDLANLPLAPASCDRVLMSEVLEHLPDDEQALREVHRVLKPGGIMALTVPPVRYPFWYDPLNWSLERLVGRPIRRGPFAGIWANHERLYEAERLVSVVERAGLRIERFEFLTHYCFPGTQFIVYTVGKGLIEAHLVPEFVSRSADRFRGPENSGRRLNPMNWALALFNWVDRWNEDARRLTGKRTFVNLAVKARKV